MNKKCDVKLYIRFMGVVCMRVSAITVKCSVIMSLLGREYFILYHSPECFYDFTRHTAYSVGSDLSWEQFLYRRNIKHPCV